MAIAKTVAMGTNMTTWAFGGVPATETIRALGTPGDGELGDR